MNINDLFIKDDINGEAIFFEDKECLCPFSGHIEDYDRDIICKEADVVDGYINGVCKDYYFKSTSLEIISGMKNNMANGLHIEFHENGMVRNLSLVIKNIYFDSYDYDREGKLISKKLWNEKPTFPLVSKNDLARIAELRKQYDLVRINEEILFEGMNFKYEKYFRK